MLKHEKALIDQCDSVGYSQQVRNAISLLGRQSQTAISSSYSPFLPLSGQKLPHSNLAKLNSGSTFDPIFNSVGEAS